jgi:hypothetical protein
MDAAIFLHRRHPTQHPTEKVASPAQSAQASARATRRFRLLFGCTATAGRVQTAGAIAERAGSAIILHAGEYTGLKSTCRWLSIVSTTLKSPRARCAVPLAIELAYAPKGAGIWPPGSNLETGFALQGRPLA